MNLKRFRAVLDLESDSGGRTVLPAAHPTAEQIFGGQILAQLIAAAATGRTVKSLQVAFPRRGRPRDPHYLDLEKTHDGRSQGMRRAVAYQYQLLGGRRIVAAASLLLDRADGEYDYQFDAAATPDPLTAKPIDFAVVPGEARPISDVGLDDVSATAAELAFWMRCPDFTDPALARPVLAYVSDWPAIGPLLKSRTRAQPARCPHPAADRRSQPFDLVPPTLRRVGVAARRDPWSASCQWPGLRHRRGLHPGGIPGRLVRLGKRDQSFR
jgi:acyl-CoA thioesterase II